MHKCFSEIKDEIRKHILENFLFGFSGDELGDNMSFSELGVLDSTGTMEVVRFLEQHFDIDIKDEEIVPENLDTINFMVEYVLRKTGRVGEA